VRPARTALTPTTPIGLPRFDIADGGAFKGVLNKEVEDQNETTHSFAGRIRGAWSRRSRRFER